MIWGNIMVDIRLDKNLRSGIANHIFANVLLCQREYFFYFPIVSQLYCLWQKINGFRLPIIPIISWVPFSVAIQIFNYPHLICSGRKVWKYSRCFMGNLLSYYFVLFRKYLNNIWQCILYRILL